MSSAEEHNLAIQRRYVKEKKVGEGTYAMVYLGKQVKTDRKIAVKEIKAGDFKDGLDMSALREVRSLRELRHPHVIELLDVFSNGPNLNLVLEFLDTDLEAIIRDKSLVFQQADIKSWMLMSFSGLEFCHRNWILHRDLKPNNLLIAADGTLKLADFGLAREFGDAHTKMTSQVVTRWYRAPELLLGARAYSTGVDVWAMGCIFAELMLRVPYLASESDLEQLQKIYQALGTPSEDDWPGHTKLPGYVKAQQYPKQDLRMLFAAASDDAIKLLKACLTYDPSRRIKTRAALTHVYFTRDPKPTHPSKLPKCKEELTPREVPSNNGNNTKKRKDSSIDVTQLKKAARHVESTSVHHTSARVLTPGTPVA